MTGVHGAIAGIFIGSAIVVLALNVFLVMDVGFDWKALRSLNIFMWPFTLVVDLLGVALILLTSHL